MSERDDGGPAFPFRPYVNWKKDADDPAHLHDGNDGMTLRDYFAAAALPACIASFDRGRSPVGTTRDVDALVASIAYACADAMLRERAK